MSPPGDETRKNYIAKEPKAEPGLVSEKIDDSPEPEHRKRPPRPFLDELTSLINRNSIEGKSNTPDFVLSQYVEGCLRVYETAIKQREVWHGRDPLPLHTRYGRAQP